MFQGPLFFDIPVVAGKEFNQKSCSFKISTKLSVF